LLWLLATPGIAGRAGGGVHRGAHWKLRLMVSLEHEGPMTGSGPGSGVFIPSRGCWRSERLPNFPHGLPGSATGKWRHY